VIHAGILDDIIYGALNDSIIYLGGGNDKVICGPGNDAIKLGVGNAEIDGGNGTNILELTGSHAEYLIKKLVNDSNGFEYSIADTVPNRNGIALVKRVHKLTFNDISAVPFNSPNAMPLSDNLNVSTGCSLLTTGEQVVFIRASQIISNDVSFASVGSLRVSAVSDPIGGTVRLTKANETFKFAANQTSVTASNGDILFTCLLTGYLTQMQFKYTVADSAGNQALVVQNLNTGATEAMRAIVFIMVCFVQILKILYCNLNLNKQLNTHIV
jgi:hypothetical protein